MFRKVVKRHEDSFKNDAINSFIHKLLPKDALFYCLSRCKAEESEEADAKPNQCVLNAFSQENPQIWPLCCCHPPVCSAGPPLLEQRQEMSV